MKISVSLVDADVTFLDDYAREAGIASRSAVVHRAVELLRRSELGTAYTEAWAEWERSDDAAAWGATTAVGLDAR